MSFSSIGKKAFVNPGAVLAGLAAVLSGCGERPSSSPGSGSSPTFARDVAPIIYENCSYCHRPGQSAPFDLLTYEDVRKRARHIAEVTQSDYMPPWLPEPGYNHFANERTLTPEQIATLGAWAEAGSPLGNEADLPTPPTFTSDWHLGTPDLIVRMAEPYHLPADGPDIYRNVVIPIPTERDHYVRALEFRPGNGRVVHHAFLAVDETEESHRLDLNDEELGFGGSHLPRSGEVPDGQFFSWQPGKLPMGGDPKRAWLLRTNSWMVIQLHMQTTGKPEALQSEVGIYFSDQPGTDITFKIGLSSYDLGIPAGATNFIAEDVFELPVDVELLAVLPHAHFLARRMQGMATLPDGSNRWLLNIGEWDFNWQGEYWYANPINLPKGSRVGMRYFYDNSTNNPVNPSNPPQPVSYGLSSTNEMAELWMIFRLQTPQDREVMNAAVLPKLATDIIIYSRKLLEGDPTNASQWVRIGSAFYALGEAEKAIDALQRALKFDPSIDEAHYFLGLIAYDSGAYDRARTSFEAAVSVNRRNYKAHGYLGLAYLRLGEYEKSEASLLEALNIKPDDQVAAANLELLRNVRSGRIPVTTPRE